MIKQDYTKAKIVIRYWLLGRGWTNAVKTMDFAEKLHTGTRKDGQPEFSHQVIQANYVRTMCDSLMFPEETICTSFLHDTVEDFGVTKQQILDLYEDSLFGERVANATMIISKVIGGVKKPNSIYYKDMANCPIASAAKGGDRVHNLMTMVGGFTPEKQASYLEETMEFTVPMLKEARRNFPKQEPFYENVKFVMTNQTILYNELLSNKNQAIV